MIGNVFDIVYICGFLVSWWYLAGTLSYNMSYNNQPEGFDVFMGYLLGFFAAAFWPVSLPIAWMYNRGVTTSERATFIPPKFKAQMMQDEIDERDRRIKQLEREVLGK